MAVFRFQGIAESVAAEVREAMRSPGYGHPAHREVARGYGPCRLCLRTFDVGSDQVFGVTYAGNEILVGRSTSAGDIWEASLRKP